LAAAKDSETSLMITAYAGCAKTSTLVMLCEALDPAPTLALAFNVKIRKELEKKLPNYVKVMTLNGLGHMAWCRARQGTTITLDDKKIGKIVSGLLKARGGEQAEGEWDLLRRLISAAQQSGVVPSSYPQQGLLPDRPETWADLIEEDPGPEQIELAREGLRQSVALAFQGQICFDDQIYMSTLFGGQFPRFGRVFVDEAQDLSPLNHLEVKATAGGRLFVVGDPKQAIYAFRGADSKSMDKLRRLRRDWVDLPLATTFRCPSVVAQRQQTHAPGFQAWKTNPLGQFLNWVKPKGAEGGAWSWESLRAAHPGQIAILCRNNAPLMSMALQLLRKGVGVQMLGRDIGKTLVALAKKILPQVDLGAEACQEAIETWAEREISLARANEREHKVSGIMDRRDCLLAVLEFGPCLTANALLATLVELFSREHGQVILATGHGAKGLEFDVVLHLDPWRIPSKYARAAAAEGQRDQLEQELNLRYVIETRAKQVLVQASLEDFQ